VCALFAKNKVRFARAGQLCFVLTDPVLISNDPEMDFSGDRMPFITTSTVWKQVNTSMEQKHHARAQLQ